MARVFLGLVFLFTGGVAAANNDDDGFVWVDANTKIRIKPIGSAAAGGTAKPEPRQEEKQEEKKKEAPKK